MMTNPANKPRRHFLGRTGAGTALLALAPGVKLVDLTLAKDEDEPASDETRWGLLVDADRCTTGCRACVSACEEEHALAKTSRTQLDPQWIRKVDLVDESNDRSVSIALMCQHCEDPPCVEVCPTGASFKRADGMVLVDKHTLSLIHI